MVENNISEGELRKEYQEKKNEAGELRMQLHTLYNEKEDYFSRLRRLRERISTCVRKIKTVKEERDQLTGEVKKLKEERQKLNHGVHVKALQKKEVEEKKKELFQEKRVYDHPQTLKAQIFHLEKKIETEVIPFSKEQQIRKKIKELKAGYQQLEKMGEVWKEVNTASANFAEQRRKAQESHQEIQEKAHSSQQKHDQLTPLFQEVTKLREEAKPINKKALDCKKKVEETKKNLDEIQKRIAELMVLLNEESERNFKQRAREKTAEVQEKIKKGKKLRTEDILAFQALRE